MKLKGWIKFDPANGEWYGDSDHENVMDSDVFSDCEVIKITIDIPDVEAKGTVEL